MPSAVNLWDKAFDSLAPDLKLILSTTKSQRRDILGAVLKEAQSKRDLSIQKRWKFTKPDGGTIIVRDVLEKITGWVHRFIATGDTVVQYDPGHAALPWAAVRFLLQVAISEIQMFGALVDDLEYITGMMVRYRTFEKLYLGDAHSENETGLQDALVRLYAEVLTHLSNAVKFFDERTYVRLLKSPFRTADVERAKAMHDREVEVEQFAKLADAEILRSLNATFSRLSVQISVTITEKKYNDIVEWLSVTSYHSHHQSISHLRLPNAGQWLLEHAEVARWQSSSSSSLLLLHGISGSGKTTLCSVIVDSLLSRASNNPSAAPFAYFYCANPEFEKARRTADDIMRTILFQLAIDGSSCTNMKEFLPDEYERQLLRSRAGKSDIHRLTTADCVRLILELAQQDPITIVIDGLDSVDNKERPRLIEALEELISTAENVVKIFVTSQTSNSASNLPVSEFTIQITQQEARQDMEEFIDHLLNTAVARKELLEGNLPHDTRELLRQGLLDGAGEMFQWAKLQIERMCREKVEADLIRVLKNEIPQDINSLYQKVLQEIWKAGDSSREVAMKVLSWVLYMREPLTPAAFLSALRPEDDASLNLRQALATCTTLVALDTNCNVVRFTHQSIQDFLSQHPHFTPAKAHQLLASCCLEACLHGPGLVSEEGFGIPSDDFYVYAAMFWPVHAGLAQQMDHSSLQAKNLVQRIIAFAFDEDWELTLSFDAWVDNVRQVASLLPRDHTLKVKLNAIPAIDPGALFPLSIFGFDNILTLALAHIQNLDVNCSNEFGQTPIYLASTFGHLRTVNLLLSHGAQVNAQGGSKGSPLHAACFWGHLEVAQSLLRHGAQVSCGSVFKTALDAACRGGREDVALFLLDVDALIESYDEALNDAALVGFIRVVERLQVHYFTSSDEQQPDKIRKKIRKAIKGGQVGVLRQFLNCNTKNRSFLSHDSVALAALYNHKSMVEFLLDLKLDLEAHGDFGSPLRTACLFNHRFIVRLLLDRGARINASGPLGHALQAAALSGHTSLAKLLIEEGADTDQRSGFYGTALQAAAYNGHLDTVELLLEAGSKTYDQVNELEALQFAAEGGRQDVIMLILRKTRNLAPIKPLPPAMGSANPRPQPLQKTLRWNLPFSGAVSAGAPISRAKKRPPVTKGTLEALSSTGKTLPLNQVSDFETRRDALISNSLLIGSASCGHHKTVQWLLEQQQNSLEPWSIWKDIPEAISAASANGHLTTLYILFDFISNETSRATIGLPEYEAAGDVDKAIELASWHLSGSEITKISTKYSRAAHKYGLVHVTISELLEDFSTTLATQLLESLALKDRMPQSGVEAFVSAAAGGSVEAMQLFTSHWKNLDANKEAVCRALVVASEHGHYTAVRYLVQDLGAPVNHCAPDLGFGPLLSPTGNRLRVTIEYSSGWMTVEGRHGVYNVQIAPDRHWDSPETDTRVEQCPKPLVISPLQACLQGYAYNFNKNLEYSTFTQFSLLETKELGEWCKHEQQKVIDFLLQQGAAPNDLGGQRMFPIQVAAKYCSGKILESLISAGADASLTGLDLAPGQVLREDTYPSHAEARRYHFSSANTALFEAAGRTASASHVRTLLLSGVTLPEDTDGKDRLLFQALQYIENDFHKHMLKKEVRPESPYHYHHHRFVMEEPISGELGRVLSILLSHIPGITTTGVKWTIALQMAAFQNQSDLVSCLISRGVNLNSVGEYYGTCLQAAARCGHVAMMRELIDAGADVNATGGLWHTALRAALVNGNEAAITLLLDNGADVRLEDDEGLQDYEFSEKELLNTLQLACESGKVDIVRRLLAHGADVTARVSGGSQHPLIMAAHQGSVAMVRDLINAGAPINICGEPLSQYEGPRPENGSPLHAASVGEHLEVIDLLLLLGADIESPGNGSETPLSAAASKGKITAVERLIQAGAKTNDNAALEKALRNGHLNVVRSLIKSGADPIGVVTLACELGNLDMIEFLLDKALSSNSTETVLDKSFAAEDLGESVTRILIQYATPTASQFCQACATGSESSVEFMLRQTSVNVNSPCESSGCFPLQLAAFHLRSDIVRVLLSHGADPDVESFTHGTPLNTALKACAAPILRSLTSGDFRSIIDRLSLPAPRDKPYPYSDSYLDDDPHRPDSLLLSKCSDIAKQLIEHGADVLRPERYLGPPLHLACLLGDQSIAELLIDKGANLNATVGHFQTPIFAAVHVRAFDVIPLLLERQTDLGYVHGEYGTPLHHACRLQDGWSAQQLLENGADATIADAQGLTPLTLVLQTELDIRHSTTERVPRYEWETSALDALLALASPIHVSDDDLLKAANLSRGNETATNVLNRLLCLDGSRLTGSSRQPIDAIDMLLKHDSSSIDISLQAFKNIFQTGEEAATRLLDLYERYAKRLPFSDDVLIGLDINYHSVKKLVEDVQEGLEPARPGRRTRRARWRQ
ncbi:multiple ankyrin repeats single kh domain-containing protein [Colletotrichum truncatum]|uniref:Multiple ankyrin repeats single kh domain-containing protein n=1 Tax=Colletotrichum truncatum TaxID=5467 RepID=A0ACC3YST0_COLTU